MTDADLAAAYRAGASLRALAREVGMSVEGVRKRLLRAGVEMRRPGRRTEIIREASAAWVAGEETS